MSITTNGFTASLKSVASESVKFAKSNVGVGASVVVPTVFFGSSLYAGDHELGHGIVKGAAAFVASFVTSELGAMMSYASALAWFRSVDALHRLIDHERRQNAKQVTEMKYHIATVAAIGAMIGGGAGGALVNKLHDDYASSPRRADHSLRSSVLSRPILATATVRTQHFDVR